MSDKGFATRYAPRAALIARLITGSVVLVAATAAQAGWTVINLHPASQFQSQANSIRKTQQVGSVVSSLGANSHAALWTGTAGSFVDLGLGNANATDGFEQVGENALDHAALWTGTAGSMVDLHPTAPNNGMQSSSAQAVFNGVQVGYTTLASSPILHDAALWTDTAASWVNLNPAGANGSIAKGEYIGQEVGAVVTGSNALHAGVWYGTANSFVDINPSGAYQSYGYGVYNGKQVGWTLQTAQGGRHASLWSNTAASWVDLNPAGAIASEAYALNNSEIAGQAIVGGLTHASFWNGTAASWEDLHAYLPAGYIASSATGLWLDNQGLAHISGYAIDAATGTTQAVIWIQSVPEPTTAALIAMTVFGLASRRRRAR